MLRARLCDPLGPRWTRSLVPALGLALIVGGLFTPADAATRAATVLAGVALMSLANLLRVFHATRNVALRVAGNGVDVRGAGALTQRLCPTDVRAARIARGHGSAAMALVRHSAPERPLILEFARDEDLDCVRRALGIGNAGFGTVTWPTEPTAAEWIRRIGSGVLGAGWTAMAIHAALDDAAACLAIAVVLVPLTCAALMAWLVAPFPMPCIALTSREVTVFDGMGRPEPLQYAAIVRVEDVSNRLVLETCTGTLVVPTRGLRAEERNHLRAQIAWAVERASGRADPPPELATSLSLLSPRNEAKRAWLDRLDATAASLATRDAYRRPHVDPKDLWDALEDPDAAATIRAAAARVLARIAPGEAKRIVRVLANERDDQTRACMAAALEEDTEAAGRKLESLG